MYKQFLGIPRLLDFVDSFDLYITNPYCCYNMASFC